MTALPKVTSPLGVEARTGDMPSRAAIRKTNGRAATGRRERRTMRGATRERIVFISVHLDCEFIYLGGRMARPLVDPHDRFARRPGREAEGLARIGIKPGPL